MKRSYLTDIRRTFSSSICAAFGVQSRANMQQDSEAGSLLGFILAGVVTTVVIVFSVMAAVQHFV